MCKFKSFRGGREYLAQGLFLPHVRFQTKEKVSRGHGVVYIIAVIFKVGEKVRDEKNLL